MDLNLNKVDEVQDRGVEDPLLVSSVPFLECNDLDNEGILNGGSIVRILDTVNNKS